MYIQALKSLISKFLQVKKMETELLKNGIDKELWMIFIATVPPSLISPSSTIKPLPVCFYLTEKWGSKCQNV